MNTIDDVRCFCLCSLSQVGNLKLSIQEDYIPKYIRIYFWKLFESYKILTSDHESYKDIRQYLRNSTATSLTPEQRQKITNVSGPIYDFLTKYTKENFKNSELCDEFTDKGRLKPEICKIILSAGIHSFASFISPVTEKIWVEGGLEFDDFINNLQTSVSKANLNICVKQIWDFHRAVKPIIYDQ